MTKGTQHKRQNALPTTIVQNHGRPVLTLMISKDHRTMPAGDQPANPMAAKSPYWSAAGAWTVRASVRPETTDEVASAEFVIDSAAEEASDGRATEATSREGSVTGVEAPFTAVEAIESVAALLVVSSAGVFGGSGTGGVVELELDPQPQSDRLLEPEGIRSKSTLRLLHVVGCVTVNATGKAKNLSRWLTSNVVENKRASERARQITFVLRLENHRRMVTKIDFQ